MTYKEEVVRTMTEMGAHPDVVFVGEGIVTGDRIYGTMDDVPTEKCIEMPIAENLIMGVAMGLAIMGFRPIVVFQRMDFMTVAADGIINHLALIPEMSNHQYELPVIIRAIIGSKDEKFDVGCQHNKDLSYMFIDSIDCTRFRPTYYQDALTSEKPYMIIERKDEYETEIT